MSLKRITNQGSETLLEYFSNLFAVNESGLTNKDGYYNFVDNMLFAIRSIDKFFTSTDIWALTSMHHLVLLKEDDWRSDWLIKIRSDYQTIFIEYTDIETRVEETIKTANTDFVYNLLVAMKATKGWVSNVDIENYRTQNS